MNSDFRCWLLLCLLILGFPKTVNAERQVQVLTQSDFNKGTLILRNSGKYQLGENITFNPNSVSELGVSAWNAGFPSPGQVDRDGIPFDRAAFGVGFFAAIAFVGNNIELDLNGFTLQQSKEHALQQRFFSLIELADQPFIPNQGPAGFGKSLQSARDIIIKNGTLGRSSHHGIHGNGNERITVKNITFDGFEVAALALNGVQGLSVKNCTATNRKDVPVLGTFSSARFLKPYIDWLVENSEIKLKVQGEELSAETIRNALANSVNKTYEALILQNNKHIPQKLEFFAERGLYHNAHGIVDGNAYGFLVNHMGVAVDGFPLKPSGENARPAQNIRFENVQVNNLSAFVNEIPALADNFGKAIIDPVGAVFQTQNRHPDSGELLTISPNGTYTGNVLANAQALVAKAAILNLFPKYLDISRIEKIGWSKVINWIESPPEKKDGTQFTYLCNGDSMFHVNKGVTGFKLDAARDVWIFDAAAQNIKNYGNAASPLCGAYEISHPKATLLGYGGSMARGYTISGSENVTFHQTTAVDIRSKHGSAVGFDVLTNSNNVTFFRNEVTGLMCTKESLLAPNNPASEIDIKVSHQATNVQIYQF